MSADPEVLVEKLTAQSLFMVLASDGVFEFMSNQEVVDMVRFSPSRALKGHCVAQPCWPIRLCPVRLPLP